MLLVYLFSVFFISISLEVLSGSFGILLPITALIIFYFTVTYCWEYGIFLAGICGIITDSLFARDIFYSPFVFFAVVLFGALWLRRAESKMLLAHLFPGGIIAVITTAPHLITGTFSLGVSVQAIMQNISTLIFSVFISAMLFPLIIVILDSFSKYFGFELYVDARDKFIARRR